MANSIRLHSFADVDRSGKVRWTACELGIDIEEVRLTPGEHMQPGYLELNPYAQIPTVEEGGEVMIESTAICINLAERQPDSGLIPVEPDQRAHFWQQVALATTSLEAPCVYYYLAKAGFVDDRWEALLHEGLTMRMATYAANAPDDGYICGDFSLADICAGYVYRLGLQAGLVARVGALASYLERLRARPAAVQSRMFDSLDQAD